MRLKTFIILCIIAILTPFILGIIHPWAVLILYGLLFYAVLAIFILLIFLLVRLIVSLFTKKNRKTVAIRLVATFVLYALTSYSLSTIAFNGMYLHYKMVDDFDKVRQWAKTVELEEDDYSYFSIKDLPPYVAHFAPLHCSVYEIDGSRTTRMSWGSGMLSINYCLLITDPETDKAVSIGFGEPSKSREIKPGVYLTYTPH